MRKHHRGVYKKVGRSFGERNGKCKISDEKRKLIEVSELSPLRLARVYGVARTTIQRIRRLAKRRLLSTKGEVPCK